VGVEDAELGSKNDEVSEEGMLTVACLLTSAAPHAHQRHTGGGGAHRHLFRHEYLWSHKQSGEEVLLRLSPAMCWLERGLLPVVHRACVRE